MGSLRGVLGAKGHVLQLAVEERAQNLKDSELPRRVRLGTFSIKRLRSGYYQLVSYSENDPLAISAEVWDFLSVLDAGHIEDLLNAPASARVGITPELIRSLLDFQILVSVD